MATQRIPSGSMFGIPLFRTPAAPRLAVGTWTSAWVFSSAMGTTTIPVVESLIHHPTLGSLPATVATITVLLSIAVLPPLLSTGPKRAVAATIGTVAAVVAATPSAAMTAVAGAVAGAVIAAALLLALLAHEFGHAVAGRRFGVENQGIVVTGFGAATSFPQDEFPSPQAMIFTTAAGPAVSAFAALLAYGADIMFDLPGWWTAVVFANLVVAAINAIPSLPLDGGWCTTGLWWAYRRRTVPDYSHNDALQALRRWWWVPLSVLTALAVLGAVALAATWAVPMLVTAAIMFPLLASTQRQLHALETKP